MTNFEMIERLRLKAGISYEEARAVLEGCNWDLVEAVIKLEKEGKITSGASYTTQEEAAAPEDSRMKKNFQRVGDTLIRWINYLCRNNFEIVHKERTLFSVPVLVLILLLVFLFWITLIALIVGLFMGARYSFTGPDLEKGPLNSAMDKAADVAESIKKDIHSQSEDSKD